MRRPKLQWWRTASGEYRCHVKAGNGRIVLADEEGFVDKSYMIRRAESKYPGAIIEEILAP